jgi:cellulose biosynthesis protein BcsQ
MKKVSIINFKGGVGKTTMSFHLAAYLALKHRVLLIDGSSPKRVALFR